MVFLFLFTLDGSVKELSVGVGGKKNRQKERRLMKGFNITPQPSGSSLPPVAEFIASLRDHPQQSTPDEPQLFGSTVSGILGSNWASKRNPHHTSTNSVPGLASSQRVIGREHRQGSTRKRRWGTLIEAAKAGRVSRLIGNESSVLHK